MSTVYTVAQLLAAQPGSLPRTFTVEDTAANISHAFGLLFANPAVRSIVVSDNGAVTLPPAGFFEALSPGLYGRVLSIANANNSPVRLSALSSVTVSQLAADNAKHIAPPPIVADTAANIAAALGQLNGDSHVTAIWVQDGAPLTLTAAQYQANARALGEIATTTAVNVTASSNESFSSVANLQTNWTLTGSNDSFALHAGFGQDVIAGYQPGRDSFSVDHTIFANFAAMFSHAASDGRGDVVITVNSHESLTLKGISLTQLQSHASDWRFT